MQMIKRVVLAASLLWGSVLGGCMQRGSAADSAVVDPSLSLAPISGEWVMDLSPAQDGSYTKSLVIVPDADAPGRPATTFTGTVYDGSPFENGLTFNIDNGVVFAFVSDEKGDMGGPYYWLGQKVTRPANSSVSEALTGRVRSLARNFEMGWSASRPIRSQTQTQSQPDAKSATKSR